MTHPHIDIPLPDNLKLFQYQYEGVLFLLQNKAAFLADEMGLGKTVQVIAYTNVTKPKKVLIVCPASLKTNWYNEFKRFSTNDYRFQIIHSSKDQISNIESVIIVSYDILTRNINIFKKMDFDLIVLDESHYIKDYKTKRCKSVLQLNSPHKIALTGTPILNRPIEIFETLKWLDPTIFPDVFDFGKRYCYRSQIFGSLLVRDFGGACNLEELQEKLTETILLRRRKVDVLPELPDKTRQIIKIDGLTKSKKIQHEKLVNEIERISKLQDKKKENVQEFIRLLALERHKIAIDKIPHTVQHVEDLLLSVEKIIIFVHHLDVLEIIFNHFKNKGVGCVRFFGGMNSKEKQGSIDDFQNINHVRIFIGTIRSAGTGITLTSANMVIFHELDFTPALMTQAEDRVHRIGQKQNVLIQHIVFESGVDAFLAKMLIRKQSIFNKMFNEDTIVINENNNAKEDNEYIDDAILEMNEEDYSV
ncbi:MAG: DEAD/DEAH box helicase [Saprospiraceae bacterium]|nr:DEAD/DEAH box helicase [Saprospiraceae bacterium]